MRRILTIFLCLLFPSAAIAQSADVCAVLLKFGVYNLTENYTDSQRFQLVKNVVCAESIQTEDQAKAAGASLGLDIIDIVDLSFGGSSDSRSFVEKRQSFCSLDFSTAFGSDLIISKVRTASPVIVNGYTDCIAKITQTEGLFAVIKQTSNKDALNITLSYRSKGSNTFYLEGLASAPTKLICERGEEYASQGRPVEIQGSTSILCTPEDAGATFTLAINTNVGPITAPDGGGYEIIGQDETLADLSRRLASVEGKTVPVGTVAYFPSECPSGWSRYTALDGRYVVAAGENSASIGTSVGSALGDQENRPTGNHTHGYTYVAVLHPNSGVGNIPGASKYEGLTAEFRGGSNTGLWYVPNNTNGSGTADGTNAPYLQLRACSKG